MVCFTALYWFDGADFYISADARGFKTEFAQRSGVDRCHYSWVAAIDWSAGVHSDLEKTPEQQ